MTPNPFWKPTRPTIASRKALTPGANFWGHFRFLLRGCFQEAPGPLNNKNHIKNKIVVPPFFMYFRICCSIRFGEQVDFPAKVLGIILALNSTCCGRVKILTQYLQIAWGCCLGVRRWPAAGVFDNICRDYGPADPRSATRAPSGAQRTRYRGGSQNSEGYHNVLGNPKNSKKWFTETTKIPRRSKIMKT